MAVVSRTVEIGAPVERVWQALIDVERWPMWASYMQSLVPQEQAPLGMGSRVRVTPKLLPGSVWEVVAWEPPRSYTWVTQLAPGTRMIAGHVVEPMAGGARAMLSLETAGALGALLSPVLGIVFRRNTRLATSGLKAYCEGRQRMENG